MDIFVAGSATGIRKPVDRIRSPWGVALIAAHAGVPPLQRISSGTVPGEIEGGGLEPRDRVARRTFSGVGAIRKLSLVGAREVTIQTASMSNGLLEITLPVT